MNSQEQRTTSKERRPLVAGLKPVDPAVESAFVYADKGKPAPVAAPAGEGREGKAQAAAQVARAPLTIRFRAEFANALKRASLQRQLNGETPNTLQDILEEAVEPWLRSHGYLT